MMNVFSLKSRDVFSQAAVLFVKSGRIIMHKF
jgi:hypothetical protein